MTIRALVVDDSAFFRRRIIEILEADPEITVVGHAADGQAAVEQAARLRPDVITMDIEMPVMDGISAVRRIHAACPTPVLMFSTLTHEGAQATLDALAAGASDFLPKRFQDIAGNREEAIRQFTSRVRAIARRAGALVRATPAATPAVPAHLPRLDLQAFQVLAIGASTGGPVALQTLLAALPRQFPLPVLVTQHMPATFTRAFAERLDQLCQVKVCEAADGTTPQPGHVYVAPGGRQMRVQRAAGGVRISVADGDPALTYRPSVDVTWESIAEVWRGRVLAVMLTGMGSDGCQSARLLHQAGATLWAQDEASCVVYGMPQAVVNAGLTKAVLGIGDIARGIAGAVR